MQLDGTTDDTIRAESLVITPEILALVAATDEFKGAWRAGGRIAPERLAALRREATIESIGSSTRIEGATLGDHDVERLLANLDVDALASRDQQEVAGYAAVMETVYGNADALAVTGNRILQLHRDLLQFSERVARHRGAYKTATNNVEATGPGGESLGIILKTATPSDTPRLMSGLVRWTRTELDGGRLHPLIVIGIFVVVFLAIHPFQDGNGRLSRILTTLLLLRAGYTYVPYSSLESVMEASRDSYYLSLRETQVTIRSRTPDWLPWLLYFLRALRLQAANLSTRLEREHILLSRLPELSVTLLDLCRQHGRLTVAAAVELSGANRNTVKDHLSRLTKAGHLARHGAGRGSWYGPA